MFVFWQITHKDTHMQMGTDLVYVQLENQSNTNVLYKMLVQVARTRCLNTSQIQMLVQDALYKPCAGVVQASNCLSAQS